MFVEGGDAVPTEQAFDVEPSRLRLSDVGGVDEVKKRLEASFLAPLRNPELRRVYGKSIRGGLLLYGPPGCGKTYIAKAIAGELEASFLSVSLSEILDMFIGNSEKNVTELFERARASAPCVLFLDELDAIGQKRTLTRHSGMRGTVNQLLTELDGVSSSNEGVYVLAATNQPWDVDEALRRPGRLDRTLLVRPPDDRARQEIFRLHLKERPVEQIDLGRLARKTDGYSGADIAHICDTAAEIALLDSVATGQVRTIRMDDLDAAISDVRPSIGPWLESARNVALFANQDGDYDELAAFLRKRKRR
jgi:SpoVK/Ycf46/Vps4 family AAA+-type ATPase